MRISYEDLFPLQNMHVEIVHGDLSNKIVQSSQTNRTTQVDTLQVIVGNAKIV